MSFKIDIMIKRKKLFLLIGLILIFLILPLSFAAENETADTLNEADDLDTNPIVNENEPTDVYFNSSVEDDGDGSRDAPFREFNMYTTYGLDGSTIHLANGEYDCEGGILLDNAIIIGESLQNTIVKNAIFASSAVYGFSSADTSLVIQNVTFVNSSFIYYNDFTSVECVFDGCSEMGLISSETDIDAYYSSGKYASIYFENSSIVNCQSMVDGVINIKSGLLEIHNSLIESAKNTLIYASASTVVLENVNVKKSKIEGLNNLIQLESCLPYIYDSNFDENIVGGSLIYAGDGDELTVFNATFTNNNVDTGVVSISNTSAAIANSTFSQNHAKRFAGAVFAVQSALFLENTTFENNTAVLSGGAVIALNTTLQIMACEFYNNSALYSGGAVYAMYGNIIIGESYFIENSALNGGAMFFDDVNSFEGFPLTYSNVFEDNGIYTITDTEYDFSHDSINPDDIFQTRYPNMIIGDGDYSLVRFTETFNGTIPEYYDLRQKGWVTPVKNQGPDGNCWAFTGIATLESCILKAIGETYDFSEVNMKNLMALFSDYGYNVLTNDGGDPRMAIAYFTSWLGPVFESDDPYSPSNYLSEVLHSYFHVQNVLFLDYDSTSIKKAIIEYGSVGIGMAWDDGYIMDASYYCWNESSPANHAVTIVGWNDSYSRYNFNSTNLPEGDGAWIIKNSWGVDEGDEGYFYVSYYDKVFGSEGTIYTFILNDTVRFDKNYQYDIQGCIASSGYDQPFAWYKNVFNATDDEYLSAVSTYFLEDDTSYTISVYLNGRSVLNQSGVSKKGYYTINLDNVIALNKGDVFEVVFKITVSDEAYIPVGDASVFNKLLSKEGVSFTSYDGNEWEDLWVDSQVACIKAFTYSGIRTNITLEIEDDKITAVVSDEYGNALNNGEVTFTINNKTEIIQINNQKAVLNYDFTKYGVYNISASWLEAGYTQAVNNINYETAWDVTVTVNDTDYNEDLVVNITLGEGKTLNDKVRLSIGNKTYDVDVNQNTVLYTVTDRFKAGLWNISLEYTNGTYYKKSINSFNVNPISSSLDDINSFDFVYSGSHNVTVSYSGAFNVTAFIVNHTEAVVLVNGNVISISNLTAGDYVLNVTTVTDENHTSVSKTANFTVKKYSVDLYFDVVYPTYAKDGDLNGYIKVSGFVPWGDILWKKPFTNLIASIEGQSDDCIVINDDGSIQFKNLKGSTYYNLIVSLNDTNYEGSGVCNFYLHPALTSVVIPDITVAYGETVRVNIETDAKSFSWHTYYYYFVEPLTFEGNTIIAKGLYVGTFTLLVSGGNGNLTIDPVTVKVTVIPKNSTLEDIDSFKYDSLDYANITVNYANATGLTAKVINHTEANVVINNNIIIISNLAVGKYVLSVSTLVDDNHTSVSKNISFEVYDSSFAALQELINNATGNITLNHDYTYHEGDVAIVIPDNLTINGNGYTISAKGKSSIFKVVGNNVVVKNIVLDGGNANNGGAVSWQGNNGTLDNATLSNNNAQNGGAVSWNGDNATISNSNFKNNNAKTGASILMNGNGAEITNTNFKNNVAGDGSDSIAIGEKVTLKPTLDDITKQSAGDILKSVNLTVSADNVIYGESVIIKVTVKYGDTLLNGTLTVNGQTYSIFNGSAVISLADLNAGDYNYNVGFNGSGDYSKPVTSVKFTVSKQSISITAKDASYVINYGGTYKITLNTKIKGETVVFTINGKKYSVVTGDNGVASLKLTKSMLGKAGTKTITVNFKGSLNYAPSSAHAQITVNKESTKLSKVKPLKKVYKRNAKTKKVKATLKDSKAKALKNKIVYLKVKGKTVKAKTNKNGIVTFKITSKIKFTKKGKYKFTVSFKGDGYYSKVNKKGTIKIK